MPLTVTPVGSVLQIVVQTGTNAQGKPILRTRSYNRVKAEATDANVNDVANALIGLQADQVTAVRRLNELEMVNA